jgi:hypothetical protein
MSTYRRNYTPPRAGKHPEVPFHVEPIAQVDYADQARAFGPLDLLMAIGIAMAIGAVVVLYTRSDATPADPQPVVQAFPAEPLTLESIANARIEGFRAGYATAVGQGCNQPVALSRPLASQ